MDEKKTVQMDAYPQEERGKGDAQSPPTIPIDDMFQESDWPLPGDEYTPPRQAPPPPWESAPPPSPPPDSAPSRRTVVMESQVSAPLLAWLAATEGPGATRGQVFTLRPDTVIGRKSGEILLEADAYVSGQHAKVRLEVTDPEEDKQSFVLYDLASANGTFAGDRESYRGNRIYRHELTDGDFILVGETTLVFKQVELDPKP